MTQCCAGMESELCYSLDRPRLGTAVLVNNLHTEQPPTSQDLHRLTTVLTQIGQTRETLAGHNISPGFDVAVYRDLTGADMGALEREMTAEERHRDACCLLLAVIRSSKQQTGLQGYIFPFHPC